MTRRHVSGRRDMFIANRLTVGLTSRTEFLVLNRKACTVEHTEFLEMIRKRKKNRTVVCHVLHQFSTDCLNRLFRYNRVGKFASVPCFSRLKRSSQSAHYLLSSPGWNSACWGRTYSKFQHFQRHDSPHPLSFQNSALGPLLHQQLQHP